MAPLLPELLRLIRGAEGLRLHVYRCPAGYPTIGWGHRVPDMTYPDITPERAEELFQQDVGHAQAGALALCPDLTGRRLAALTDLVFNVGAGALDGEDPRSLDDDAGVVKALRAGDWRDAAMRFRKWDHIRVDGVLVENEQIKQRREVGARWIEEG
jgi:lysozyme